MSFSRGSSQPRDWTHVSCSSCMASGFFTTEPPWGSPNVFQPSAKNWREMGKWMHNCGRLWENSRGHAPTTWSSCYLCRELRIRDCCYTHWQTYALSHKSTLLGQKISALQWATLTCYGLEGLDILRTRSALPWALRVCRILSSVGAIVHCAAIDFGRHCSAWGIRCLIWSKSDPIIWIQAKPQSNHKISKAATILEMSNAGWGSREWLYRESRSLF